MRGGAGQGEIRTGEQVKNAGGTVFYTSGRNGLWFIVSEPQQKMCHAKPSGNNGCRFAEKGYYIAVLNQWYCPKCYDEFCKRAKYYQEDTGTEKRNYELYSKLFGV